ncbi:MULTISPECIES: metal-dependent transcriptional regulator [Anaerotruncus]|jgi:DtxR family Mn-dependent transcriptional regulator|uniref:Metal-dependent transcriptional regulator n=1 Tax=Anaerotruncus colihominis TaxID=169435 RepID=A0A845RED4_9FIRM|nr:MULTISPECIES: metal-dependent transcriptional regulator [Anaerotruncus]MCI8491986.1 metal-dependent transcriptional regulator [Anaerotruncus sp.]MCR2025053.1 metal-dependent transcriptional regulator [Anaerotruncus colihominis]NBI78033.1 metal-dependent transcriptional regulator [Anaerotruncus colihominis]NDO40102.1 metal-dependent transcriptional regulator [Anaerotruncus colihominis]
MNIHESAENYLEAILILKNERGAVRSIDIAQHMQFSKPSVSRAMSLLRGDGYITVDPDGFIELAESGLAIAERIYERHRLMTDWLVRIGVSPDTAARDACKVEHDISEETFKKLKEHINEHIHEAKSKA